LLDGQWAKGKHPTKDDQPPMQSPELQASGHFWTGGNMKTSIKANMIPVAAKINFQNIPAAALILSMDPEDLEARLQAPQAKNEIPETEIRDLLTVKDIAFKGNFSHRYAQKLLADGKIKYVKFVRRCVRVPLKEWQRFLKGVK
jgi:hypothetical protein